jgi:hypothetical protein
MGIRLTKKMYRFGRNTGLFCPVCLTSVEDNEKYCSRKCFNISMQGNTNGIGRKTKPMICLGPSCRGKIFYGEIKKYGKRKYGLCDFCKRLIRNLSQGNLNE